jgi:hypothetical protein
LAAGLAVLLQASCGLGAGTRDLADGWLLGPGAVGRLLGDRSAPSAGAWGSAGQARLYGMAELPVSALAVGWRLARWPGQPTCEVSWQRLGDAYFREDERRVHLQVGRILSWGLMVGQVRATTDIAGVEPLPALSVWHAAMTAQWDWYPAPDSGVRVQLWLSLREAGEADLARARRPLLRAESWRGPTAVAVAVDLKADLTPVLGLEAVLGGGGAACGVRLEPDVGVVGPVLYLRRGALQLGTSHLMHPQLGVTHRLRVGFGAWGAPRW